MAIARAREASAAGAVNMASGIERPEMHRHDIILNRAACWAAKAISKGEMTRNERGLQQYK